MRAPQPPARPRGTPRCKRRSATLPAVAISAYASSHSVHRSHRTRRSGWIRWTRERRPSSRLAWLLCVHALRSAPRAMPTRSRPKRSFSALAGRAATVQRSPRFARGGYGAPLMWWGTTRAPRRSPSYSGASTGCVRAPRIDSPPRANAAPAKPRQCRASNAAPAMPRQQSRAKARICVAPLRRVV